MCSSNIIWDDVRDASKMKTLKPPLPHRLDIEKRIIDADVEGNSLFTSFIQVLDFV